MLRNTKNCCQPVSLFVCAPGRSGWISNSRRDESFAFCGQLKGNGRFDVFIEDDSYLYREVFESPQS